MAFRNVGPKSAKQIAASKRNIIKAQAASARVRRGNHRNSISGHYYGSGRAGRKAAKRALYGSHRHGISPVQLQRRQGRLRNRVGRAAVRVGVTAGTLAATYYVTSSPQNRANINARVKNYSQRPKRFKAHYGNLRGMGFSRKFSAKNASGQFFM